MFAKILHFQYLKLLEITVKIDTRHKYGAGATTWLYILSLKVVLFF